MRFDDHEIHAAWLASLMPSAEAAAARAPTPEIAAWAELSWRIGRRILERYTVHVSAPFPAGADGDRRILAGWLHEHAIVSYSETSAKIIDGIEYRAYVGLAPRVTILSA